MLINGMVRQSMAGNKRAAKLMKSDVSRIRASRLTDAQEARRLGVTRQTIWNIRVYNTWR